MLAGPHLATGAVIGRALRRPWLALPLAFGSHYLLDALPHAYMTLRDGQLIALKAAIVSADALVGIGLVLWLAWREPRWGTIAGSALAAGALDLLNPITPVGVWLAAWPGTAWLISLHVRHAWHVPFGDWLAGFGHSVVVIAVAAVAGYLLKRGRKAIA